MALLDDAVYLELALVIFACDRHRARVIAAVELHGLGAAVTQGEASGLEWSHRGVAVHDLAMLREDGGKTYLGAITLGDAIDLATDILLGHTRLNQTHGRGVHQIAHFGGTLEFGNLLGGLD